MADDIVTRLRQMATDRARYATHYDGCDQSHLECAALHACNEIERLRVAGDALAAAVDIAHGCRCNTCVMARAWQEARRG